MKIESSLSVHHPVSVQVEFVELRITVTELQFDFSLHPTATAANLRYSIFNPFGQADLRTMLVAGNTNDRLAGHFAHAVSDKSAVEHRTRPGRQKLQGDGAPFERLVSRPHHR